MRELPQPVLWNVNCSTVSTVCFWKMSLPPWHNFAPPRAACRALQSWVLVCR